MLLVDLVYSYNQSPSKLSITTPHTHTTHRKQSLVNQSTNPFAGVVLALEQLSDCVDDLEEEHIVALTQPLIGWGTAEELMGLAKTSSRSLYGDLEPNDSVDKINILVRNPSVDWSSSDINHTVCLFAVGPSANPAGRRDHQLFTAVHGARRR